MTEWSDVFISYPSCDLDIARGLHDRLVAEGFKVWFDQAQGT